MAHVFINTASVAQLNAGIDAVTISVVLTGPTFSGWPTTYPYWGIIARGTSVAEIVEVTAGAGTTLTVVRGRDGTTAAPHNTGDTFEHIIPADTANGSELHIDATEAHGATGAVVGTTNAQTLTKKLYQGGHKHVFTDADPAALTAGFETVADNASARDGFVHRNTSGDSNRRGFLLEQSGTPRVELFNDGTLLVTPNGSAVRKGIETTTSLKTGTTLEVGTNATVTGTLGVTGVSTLASATVTGNASVSGTLGVTGTTTAATVNATDVNASGAVAATGAVTGATVTATNQLGSYGGRAVASVANTAAVSSPTTGQVVYDISTDRFLKWNGTVWTEVRIGGEWRANANKTINTGLNKIQFQTTLVNNGITSDGENFQVPYDGLYAMTAFFKFSFAPSLPTSAAMSVRDNGGTVMYSGEGFFQTPSDVRASCIRYLTASTTVSAFVYSNDGASKTSDIAARPHEFALWKVG